MEQEFSSGTWGPWFWCVLVTLCNPLTGGCGQVRLGSSPKEQVMGQEEAASGGARRGLVWMLGKISSWKALFSPGEWWSHQKTRSYGT